MDGIGGSCILSIYSSVIQLLGNDCTEQVEESTPTNLHPSANTFSRTTACMNATATAEAVHRKREIHEFKQF
jgi:hypothetical protein